MNAKNVKLEYLWLDGSKPTPELRSKTKVISLKNQELELEELPLWSFDGSSTEQAEGEDSDCILKPVSMYRDPFRRYLNQIVMCEVLNSDGSPHKSNTRRGLEEINKANLKERALFGIEQEYVLYENNFENVNEKKFYGWPKNIDKMPPQGRYYCGVGSDRVLGREIVEEHLDMCLEANLGMTGINAEVMASQWEFQVGTLSALEVSDQLWVARWILHRVCEKHNVVATFHPKPLKGDWNGSGAHINFSTENMRKEGGIKYIKEACERLSETHEKHIKSYGANNDERLTGKHETCDIDTFRYGVADRGASIRIPRPVSEKGCGYLEDRRPSSNVDPYVACKVLMETICKKEELAY
jgi:glutamine synthetase